RRRGHPRVLPRRHPRVAHVVPRHQALQATEAVAVVTSQVVIERPAGPEPSGDPVLQFEDVELAFEGVKALDGISFEVLPGELFAVIGPNGAGKTSIFNVLSGVYRPQAGRVRFLGEDVLGVPPHKIAARGMARTFQNIELFVNLDVVDNLMLGRHNSLDYGWPS